MSRSVRNVLLQHYTGARYGLGLSFNGPIFDNMMRRYSEPHRVYHTADHIAACLDVFDGVAWASERPSEVTMALLYHDIVYDPTRRDNEPQSASLLRTDLEREGASPDVIARIEHTILATALHVTTGESIDTQLVLDIDLSILGAVDATFDAYDVAIRAEYAFVPEEVFLAARRDVLMSFLGRDHIYATEPLRERFEMKARANLARAITRLDARKAGV